MAQRLLALVVLALAVVLVIGNRMQQAARQPTPSPTGQIPTQGPPPRALTLVPHPDALAPEIGTPGIDMLAILAIRRRIAREGSRVYLDALLAETDSTVVRWPDRPTRTLMVRFVPDSTIAGWSDAALSDAHAGLQAWAGNSAGISFSEATDSSDADITVNWFAVSPRAQEAGNTDLVWGPDGVITRAAVHLALKLNDSTPMLPSERRRAAAHEFGHAVGLPHSGEPEDLMFARTEVDAPSRRDNATLLLLYSVPPGSLKVP